jgi:hypothetical protein
MFQEETGAFGETSREVETIASNKRYFVNRFVFKAGNFFEI